MTMARSRQTRRSPITILYEDTQIVSELHRESSASAKKYERRIPMVRRVAFAVGDTLLPPLFPAQSVESRGNQSVLNWYPVAYHLPFSCSTCVIVSLVTDEKVSFAFPCGAPDVLEVAVTCVPTAGLQ